MARSEARIFTSIWNDTDFVSLPLSVQRIYFLALSQPTLSLCGVTAFGLRRWAGLAPDSTARSIRRDVATLVDRQYAALDEGTEELWLRSFLKWDIGRGLFRSNNLVVGVAKDFVAIASAEIRTGVALQLAEGMVEGFPKGLPEDLAKRLPEGFTKGLANALPEGSLAGVRARSPASSSNSLSGTPLRAETTSADVAPGAVNDEVRTEDQELQRLLDWWLVAVPEQRRTTKLRIESVRVLTHLRAHLDDKFIETIIGTCARNSPGTAAYLLSTAVDHAARSGIKIPEMPAS